MRVNNENFDWLTGDIDRKVIFIYNENFSGLPNDVVVETTARQTIQIAEGTNEIQPFI